MLRSEHGSAVLAELVDDEAAQVAHYTDLASVETVRRHAVSAWRSRSGLARPHIAALSCLTRLTMPSTAPELKLMVGPATMSVQVATEPVCVSSFAVVGSGPLPVMRSSGRVGASG